MKQQLEANGEALMLVMDVRRRRKRKRRRKGGGGSGRDEGKQKEVRRGGSERYGSLRNLSKLVEEYRVKLRLHIRHMHEIPMKKEGKKEGGKIRNSGGGRKRRRRKQERK